MQRPHTTAEIIEKLEAARASITGPAHLAFDADGTLWRGDVGVDLFSTAIRADAFREPGIALLRREAATLGHRADDAVDSLAARLLVAFADGTWEDEPAAIAMALAFAGHDVPSMTALAEHATEQAALASRVHPGVREIIAWARRSGVRVVVVSASPRAMVVAAVRHAFGIAETDVLAMTPTIEAGRLVARLEGPSVYGAGKVRALTERLADSTLLGGFGDSAGDRFFLAASRVAVGVGPNAKLLAHAAAIEGFAILPFPSEAR